MTDISKNAFGLEATDLLYDPVMEPLVQSSLAHFLFFQKHGIEIPTDENGVIVPNHNLFHPNSVRFEFLDDLIANNASVTLHSFKLLEFYPPNLR